MKPCLLLLVAVLASAQTLVDYRTQLKNKPFIFITDSPYNAKADGVTDNTAAINAAIAAGIAQGGATIRIPCGLSYYRINGSINVTVPNISLQGDNQACAILKYTGASYALKWQMSPFSIQPAGSIEDLTILGTSAATDGILSGQIVASQMRNVVVAGFTSTSANSGKGAAGLHLHNSGSLVTWTERNDYINVSLGGIPTTGPYNTIGVLMDSDDAQDSFGYNRFLDLKLNISTGGTGFYLASGFFYNAEVSLVCNSDNNLAGTVGPICIRSSGNWDSITSTIDGEFQNTGSGTGTPYSVQVDVGGKFNGWGQMAVFGTGSTPLAVNNLAGAAVGASTVTLRQNAVTSWDTGTYTIQPIGTATSPNPTQRAQYGSLGLLLGNNIESPYVAMFDFGGNKFVIGTVAFGQNLGAGLTERASVNNVGDFYTAGHIWGGGVTSATTDNRFSTDLGGRLQVRGDNAPQGGAPAFAIDAGWRTGTSWSGGANMFMATPQTAGINESLQMGDTNGQAGLGMVIGTNIAHPILWGYNIDTRLVDIYAKRFQAPIINTDLVAYVDPIGGWNTRGHLNQLSTIHNIGGSCDLSGSTSCAFTFSDTFTSTPICTMTAGFDIGSTHRLWVTPSTSACTVTADAATTGTVYFTVIGNPN